MRPSSASLPIAAFLAALMSLSLSCSPTDNPVGPYGGGGRPMSSILVQDSVFAPKITWLGGYVTAIGVNRGTIACLDSTLVWLTTAAGNNIHFPITFGDIPSGSQSKAAQYGGASLTALSEDNLYTFWILKQEGWDLVAAHPGVPFVLDTGVTGTGTIVNDTLHLGRGSHSQVTRMLDVYVNVKDVKSYGQLADFTVTPTDTSNDVVIRWKIKQTGVTDSTVALIGLVDGSGYMISRVLWEVVTKDSAGQYWHRNGIASPVVSGAPIPSSGIFVSYPPSGLERGHDCQVYIAAKEWDQMNRLRSTKYYGWVSFKIW